MGLQCAVSGGVKTTHGTSVCSYPIIQNLEKSKEIARGCSSCWFHVVVAVALAGTAAAAAAAAVVVVVCHRCCHLRLLIGFVIVMHLVLTCQVRKLQTCFRPTPKYPYITKGHSSTCFPSKGVALGARHFQVALQQLAHNLDGLQVCGMILHESFTGRPKMQTRSNRYTAASF